MKTKQTFGLWWVIAVASALGVHVNAGRVIAPAGAVASHEYVTATAADVIDASRLNGSNQLIPGTWADNWLFDGTAYASSSMGYYTSQHWIYIDLGAEYVLDEIRIWNYFDTAPNSGRGVREFYLYTGREGAALPTGPQSFGVAFPAAGNWTLQVDGLSDSDNYMTQAPQATEPIGPTDVFLQARGRTARYVAIDVGTYLWNGSGGNSLGGLSMIQVTELDVITPVSAAASSVWSAAPTAVGASDVIQYSRLDPNNQLNPGTWADNWLFDTADHPVGTLGESASHHWIYVDLGAEYILDEVRVWNYFDSNAGDVSNRGVRTMRLYTAGAGAALPSGPAGWTNTFKAADGWTWTGANITLTQAPVATVPIAPTDVLTQLQGVTARYIGIDVANLWSLAGFGGLSLIQPTGQIAIPEARSPDPYDGKYYVPVNTVLSWDAPTTFTPTGYDVYLDTDPAKVIAGTGCAYTSTNQPGTSFDPGSDLTYGGAAYYWRVKSLGDPQNFDGDLWGFTTMTAFFEAQKTINRVELMPNIPSPFDMKDWKATALGFDQLAFDFEATGDYLPLIWWDTTRKNFDRNIFGLPDHVGRPDTSPTFGDGSNHSFWCSMGSVLGATLVGLDKSHQWCASTRTFQNWVLQCENYFNLDNGENVFLWGTSVPSGVEWLYELTPTVWMFQLNHYYPSVGDIENNLKITTDRWYDSCVVMGGLTNPWTNPDYNWTAFEFSTMTPITGGWPGPDWTEPDVAGSYAWIGYMAWVRWQDPNHLDMADWGLGFLENASENPLHSVLTPYGAYTAARMNAELGRTYDIDKLMNWNFDRSDLHPALIVQADNWGGYDVHGLWGGTGGVYGGYAYAMETFNMVGALLPVVRYDDGYARAIGKWILNAANNCRLFYPDVLPSSHQSSSFWTGDPGGVIGYEGLVEIGPVGQTPYARGDAISSGTGPTDLGLYGGSLVGILGGTLSPTNEAHIFQLDCLKTDYYHDTAYPTYLYYNPETTARAVNIDVGPAPKDLYDTVSKRFLAQSVTGTIDFYIPADFAVIVVVAPAGGARSFVNGKRLLIDGVIVDYNYDLDDWQNSFVGMESFVSMAASWLQTGDTMPQDLNRDKIINLKDFAILADRWQQD